MHYTAGVNQEVVEKAGLFPTVVVHPIMVVGSPYAKCLILGISQTRVTTALIRVVPNG